MKASRPRWWAVVLSGLFVCGCADEEPALDEDPRWTAHRLNRSEYDRTVRDLLSTQQRPAQSFPADERGNGFDTMSALLSVSPEHMTHYERAAEMLADEAAPQLFDCDTEDAAACVERGLRRFLPRAYRRPVEEREVDALMSLWQARRDDGDDVGKAAATIVEASLLSPQFLFRTEHRPLLPYERASRLSYFLWSSMPDDALMEAAERGELEDAAGLRQQVLRMLDDARSDALVEDFAGQWLYFRALDDVFKDAHRYPAFDEDLRASMRDELDGFFRTFIAGDRDFRELLTSNTTVVDERMMVLYGRATEPFEGQRELELDPLRRRGLLTMPGLMAILARPFRTSPVERGAWVLGQLQCEPPPTPPPSVEGFDVGDDPQSTAEQLEAHRANPACAGCHDAIDPIGLALEEYDAIGAWRPVDEDDRMGMDALQLADQLAADPAFTRCVVQQTLTYALGRSLDEPLQAEVDSIHRAWSDEGFGSRSLFVLVAQSPAFGGAL